MKLYKEIEIDIDVERARIKKVNYSVAERAKLYKLVDLFESGDFCGAMLVAHNWSREEKEFIDPTIWDIILAIDYGECFYTAEEIASEYNSDDPTSMLI